PLDAAGRAAVSGWSLPPELTAWAWRTSPLLRCQETARLLDLAAATDDRLIEMDWGAWEGRSLRAIAAEEPAALAAREARGIHMTPPPGPATDCGAGSSESPAMVMARLAPLLAAVAAAGRDCGFVTHKGVIRALLALATDWDMTGPPPARVAPGSLQLLALDGRRLRLLAADLALNGRPLPVPQPAAPGPTPRAGPRGGP
ncbi:MAG: histidine phosphatase family protein, partial [Alphaproteobacteria bacterium]